MKKIILIILFILSASVCFCQIQEGADTRGTLREGVRVVGQQEEPEPEPPLNPYAVYTFYMPYNRRDLVYGGDALNKEPVHYDSETGLIVDGDWTQLINEIFTPVMLTNAGLVDYELSRTDYRYRADNTTLSDASDVNYNGNAMVRVKKFYVKAESGDSIYPDYNASVSISLFKADSGFEALGFVDANGNECDYAYMSMFEGYVDSNNKLRSLAGVVPTLGTTSNGHDYFVARATANGSGWNIESRAFKTALDYLHVLLFKDIRPVSQTGQGYRNGNGSVSLATGQSYGKYNTFLTVLPKTLNNGRSKTFWIENFLDGDFRWVNGLYFPSSNNYIYTKNNEPYDVSNLSNWTSWECSNSDSTDKVRLIPNSNSDIAYYPIFRDNTVMFSKVYTGSAYLQAGYWGNTTQYFNYQYKGNYGMTGQCDYFAYQFNTTREMFFNSILSYIVIGTSPGKGQWYKNCVGRLTYLR